jgi:hypothetical protein
VAYSFNNPKKNKTMNNKNLAYIIVGILVIFPVLLFSQDKQQNLEKYWNYRERLRRKFMFYTNCQTKLPFTNPPGVVLSANVRNPTNRQHVWKTDAALSEIENERPNTMSWGDATSYHGFYLGVLATEYKLLDIYGQDTDETLDAIEAALRTLERLDWMGDVAFGTNFIDNSNYNGFFIRDDVHADFIQEYGNSSSVDFTGIEYVKSDYNYTYYSFGSEYDKEMSQDQVWNLLLGLALIKKFVDAPDQNYDTDNEYVTFKKWAQKLAARYIFYMHAKMDIFNTTWWYTCDYTSSCWPGYWDDPWWDPTNINVWKLYNPVTKDRVARGGKATQIFGNAYYFAAAGQWITDSQFGSMHHGLETNLCTALPMNFGYSFTSGSFQVESNLWDPEFNTDYSRLLLSTISNLCNAQSMNDLLFWISRCASYYNYQFASNENDIKTFAYEHLPLLKVLLHNDSPNMVFFDYYMSFIENILDLAPASQYGPCRYIYDFDNDQIFSGNDYDTREWATANRLWKPIGVSIFDEEPAGEYNGLDYMLLHNLYWLAYDYLYSDPKNITEDFPYENDLDLTDIFNGYFSVSPIPLYVAPMFPSELGKDSNPTLLHQNSQSSITANNVIDNDGKVLYRAGTSINFEPGFKIESGGQLLAMIDENANIDFENTNPNFMVQAPIVNIASHYNLGDSTLIDSTQLNNKSTANTNSDFHCNVFPNPAKDIIIVHVYGTSLEITGSLTIRNSVGQIVYKQENIETGKFQVDLNRMSSGLYNVHFEATNNITINKKLIVQK